MDLKHSANRRTVDRRQTQQPTTATFTAPLGSAASGRLVFASGAAEVSLGSDQALEALYGARFEREIPGIAAHKGIITIQYSHAWPFDWLLDWRGTSAKVVLNGSIPWEVEFRRGVSKLTADLRRLRLRSLDLASIGEADITLPQPAGVAYIHFGGSASNVAIRRPAGVGVQFNLTGSAAKLALDGNRFRSVSDGFRWRSAECVDCTDRYEITVSGSISRFSITTR